MRAFIRAQKPQIPWLPSWQHASLGRHLLFTPAEAEGRHGEGKPNLAAGGRKLNLAGGLAPSQLSNEFRKPDLLLSNLLSYAQP